MGEIPENYMVGFFFCFYKTTNKIVDKNTETRTVKREIFPLSFFQMNIAIELQKIRTYLTFCPLLWE